MTQIHPTAIIEDGAVIEEGVVIEPYAIIKKHVRLCKGVCIKAHAYIDGHTTIGDNTVIWPGASIGTMTQDLKYRGETTFVEIGKRCQIREFATINSSTGEGEKVIVGDDCLIMAYCHIAHNCQVGNHVIMSNNATLAGHVTVEDYVIIGGLTPVHQNVRIGSHAMVGGMSRVVQDVPPFTIGAGIPYRLGGLNLVGLKRRGFTSEDRAMMTRAFKITYRQKLPLEQALEKLMHEYPEDRWVCQWVKFCRASVRGLVDLAHVKKSHEETDACE